ncbi:ABC transporter substrate-binding protein (plasmid) [Neorhizobium sp. SOG26]|jgi:ABC-type branched-chain amino acid transport systems, periplasmic component|uniref:ABC transporter substrate-binding protein n=1 Tax=Neorhizobium turbinariae TaxID=2937795 RepID=A0ABT0IPE5_9HYPH|nr:MULTISPECIES: ABC transporter substrate-binding protein [Neorhizobium]AXV18310.1 ABC transporter substrate-binding protein [Neorhizobium sp. SOG26]MCK8779694.1 ABC transporter substrate-binding protein [Neorhizobium turbinariae]
MLKRRTLLAAAGVALGALAAVPAAAQETVKVGLILPMTGPFASTGRQVSAGAKTFLEMKGDTVAGKKIELIIRDDAGVADQTRRIAQELVVNEGVKLLAGGGLTPLAMAVAPVATQAKVPMIVTSAGTASITKASPFITRTSGTLPQYSLPVGTWAAENGIKKVVTLVSDYGPGIDAEKWFSKEFKGKGGEIIEAVRVPLANPDFAPFLQRVRDAKPDAVFVFLPSGAGALFMKQFADRGLPEAGVKLIATGDVTDDDILNSMGKPALGTITGHFYATAHDSPENKAYVEAFTKANDNMRPNFMSVGGYDSMALIYAALEKTNGDVSGPAFMEAVKGMSWTSPRGPVSIDPETRDIIQNIYMREVKELDGELHNVEFATFKDLKDPEKAEAN